MIKTTLGIEGMMCGMCESHINNAIRKLEWKTKTRLKVRLIIKILNLVQ